MNLAREDGSAPLRLHFDRFVRLALRGSAFNPVNGSLLHRELNDAFALTDLAASLLAVSRTGRHGFAELFRQLFYSRLAGYE